MKSQNAQNALKKCIPILEKYSNKATTIVFEETIRPIVELAEDESENRAINAFINTCQHRAGSKSCMKTGTIRACMNKECISVMKFTNELRK